MNRQTSEQIFAHAQTLMPGGVNSAARAFGAVGGIPLVIDRGEGARIWDADQNEYLDYIGSWGPMILGHRHPQVIRSISQALNHGTSFGAPTRAENEMAELIIDAVPSVEKVRLVSSGTEATMSAIRLARGATGRTKIIKFAGNYHGHVDCLLVAAGSAAATLAVPNSPGVTAGTAEDTIILPFNNIQMIQEVFQARGSEIAGVILEPVAGNMGCVAAEMEFLTTLRELTQQHGSILIFDEVMCGFRVAYGGAQQRFEVLPDLTTLGKIVGGGMPLGAFGGRAELMDHILPAGKVFQAGTLSGNPVATAAGIATLKHLKEHPPYDLLEQRGHQLEDGLKRGIADAGVEACVQRVGSMITLFFHPGPVRDWDDAAACDTQRFSQFFWNMMDRGIYLPCSQYEAWFISAAHSQQDIEQTIAAAAESLRSLS